MNSKKIKSALENCLSALVLVLLVVGFNSIAAFAQSTSIARIDGESDKAVSLVTVGLSNRPEWSDAESLKIEDHGTFVQVVLPGTVVPSPGTFLDANSPVITKIAAFQVTNATSGQATDAAIRLFVNQDAAQVRQALVAELMADRVIVTLDHKKLTGITEKSKVASVTPVMAADRAMTPKEPTPAELALGKPDIPSSETVNGAAGSMEASNSIHKSGGWSTVGAKVPNLAGKLTIVSGFSLFMLILLGIAHKWRQFRSKRIPNDGVFKHRVPASENGEDYARDNTPMGLKTLTSMTVAPRQKLVLMQAGPDTILIAITPNGIQFLTKVGDQSTQESNLAGLLLAQTQSVQFQQLSSSRQDNTSKNFSDRLEIGPTDDQETHPVKAPKAANAGGRNSRQGASTQEERNKVRIAVTDKGIESVEDAAQKSEVAAKSEKPGKSTKNATQQDENKPSDDITRLIREKLRNLPVI